MTRGGEMVRMNGRKYSSQVREYSDYDEAKEEMLTDKPAINTLKKTFTAMLSRIGNSRMMGGTGDTSSDNISVNSRCEREKSVTLSSCSSVCVFLPILGSERQTSCFVAMIR